MPELKCPHCQKTFVISQDDYASLLSQVRNDAFEKELHARLEQLEEINKKQKEIDLQKAKNDSDQIINKLNNDKAVLEQKLKDADKEKEAAVSLAVANKEKELMRLENELQVSKQKNALEISSLNQQHANDLRMKDKEIEFYKDLKARMSTKLVGETLLKSI